MEQIKSVQSAVDVLFKDLLLALKQSEGSSCSVSISKTTSDAYENAIQKGLGEFDGSTLTRFLVND